MPQPLKPETTVPAGAVAEGLPGAGPHDASHDQAPPAPRRSTRFGSLDVLRGLAALVVVVHHSVLVAPALAAAYGPGDTEGTAATLLTFTPLHLLWNGPAAVTVFFVLSGLVLAVAGERLIGASSWARYYAGRLLRLYLPVAASVALAVGLYFLVPRDSNPSASWWLNSHDDPLPWSTIVRCVTLVTGTDSLNSALWSLRWEVIFSLALPAYLLLGRCRPAWAVVQGGGLLGIMLAWGPAHASLRYLPVFGLGVLLAAQREPLFALARRARSAHWVLLGVVCVLLIESPWLVGADAPPHWGRISRVLVALGGVLIVALFLLSPAASRLAQNRVARWLGTISFSLYLTHEPIAVSVSFLLVGRAPLLVILLVSVALALPAAHLFFRVVEQPTHRLARRVGSTRRA